jgi:capsular polysaccharide biosynthesis protein
MMELANSALDRGIDVRVVELEEATLGEQVALFAATRIVVGQHGAGLVNMLWLEPGGVIVEINPLALDHPCRDYFRHLAAACGHAHIYVRQLESHATVDEAEFLEALRTAQAALEHYQPEWNRLSVKRQPEG